MEKLRAILKGCSQLLKQEELLSFREHCFLVFLLDMYRDVPAVTVKEITSKILETATGSTSAPFFLPTDASTMAEICTQMNKRGNILYLHNTDCPGNSWIVLQKGVLLEIVNGSIFAPKDFKEHTAVATDTGIVPVSKLTAQFPDIDTNLIVSFMCHLQFCLEVTDPEILQQLSMSGDFSKNEKFLFFPSLVTIKAPVGVWDSSIESTYQSAWVLQCHSPTNFYTTRFQHLVIHRLAFSFAMATHASTDHITLHRRCNVWKNGIFWFSLEGVSVLVEFVNNNRLTILFGAKKGCELNAITLRSNVISAVLKAKANCCPKIVVEEFLSSSDSLSYPLKSDLDLTNIVDVAKSIVNCQAYCYCDWRPNIAIEVARLVHFEPFSNLGHNVLQKLFTREQSELSDESLRCIADRAYFKTDTFVKILDISPSALDIALNSIGAPTGVTSKLLCALQLWRNKEHTYSSLCRRLSEYSVFAGRNPLVSLIFICITSSLIVSILYFHFRCWLECLLKSFLQSQ